VSGEVKSQDKQVLSEINLMFCLLDLLAANQI